MKAPKRWPEAIDWWCLLIAAWLFALLLIGGEAHAAPRVEPGDKVTYTDATGRRWCATVHAIVTGPDSDPWAWLLIDADPRRIVREPVRDLTSGCGT